jgi:archaeal cell division control protein 6
MDMMKELSNEVEQLSEGSIPFKIDIKRAMEKTIWKNKRVLSKGYPGNFRSLVHRQKEIDNIVYNLSDALKGIIPANMFMYGKMGTGKTLVTKLVTSEIVRQTPEYKQKVKVIYIQCETLHTNIAIIRELNEQLETEKTKTCNAFDMYFKKFCRLLNDFNGVLIIVLDEIDLLDDPNVINILCRLKENDFGENVCIIGITNDITFGDNLNARTKSVLSQQNLVFPPYDANQLKDILQERAEIAFEPNTLQDTIVPLCAAYAARENGDVRKAIELLRTAGEITEANGESLVTEANVKKAQQRIEQDKLTELIRTLPTQHKTVLLSCLIEESDNLASHTGEIYKMYRELSNAISLEQITQRRMSDILSELAIMGIINAITQNKGRYGRTKEVTVVTRTEDIFNILSGDYRLNDVVEMIKAKRHKNKQSKLANLIL